MIATSLSQINTARWYLRLLATGTGQEDAEVVAAETQLAEAQAALAAAAKLYEEEQAALGATRESKRPAVEAAETALKVQYAAPGEAMARYIPSCIARSEANPDSLSYDEIKVTLWKTYGKAQAELRDVPYANSVPRDSAEAVCRDAQKRCQRAQKAHQEILDENARAFNALDEKLSSLPRPVLEELVQYDLANSEFVEEYGFEDGATTAAFLRGETSSDCSCKNGYLTVLVEVANQKFEIVYDDSPRHPVCHIGQTLSFDWLGEALPAKHAHHRMHALKAWPHSPMAEADQQLAIKSLPQVEDDLYGLVLIGPPGTSKTTYAAAVIADWLTWRFVNIEVGDVPKPERRHDRPNSSAHGCVLEDLNFWRIKAPAWMRAMEAYEQRDFEDSNPPAEPPVTVHAIENASLHSPYRPILWLEELDKFSPTKNRLRNLYSLVDAVYEANGVIVSTSNMRSSELKEHLGEAIFRRLWGTNEAVTEYHRIDLFVPLERAKKGAKR